MTALRALAAAAAAAGFAATAHAQTGNDNIIPADKQGEMHITSAIPYVKVGIGAAIDGETEILGIKEDLVDDSPGNTQLLEIGMRRIHGTGWQAGLLVENFDKGGYAISAVQAGYEFGDGDWTPYAGIFAGGANGFRSLTYGLSGGILRAVTDHSDLGLELRMTQAQTDINSAVTIVSFTPTVPPRPVRQTMRTKTKVEVEAWSLYLTYRHSF